MCLRNYQFNLKGNQFKKFYRNIQRSLTSAAEIEPTIFRSVSQLLTNRVNLIQKILIYFDGWTSQSFWSSSAPRHQVIVPQPSILKRITSKNISLQKNCLPPLHVMVHPLHLLIHQQHILVSPSLNFYQHPQASFGALSINGLLLNILNLME